MQINNQSIQDMHIFGDPSRIPIIIVERVVNVPRRTTSGNSYFSQLDQKDTPNLLTVPLFNAVNKSSVASPQQNGRVLKIVVFVHGFQVCSLLNVCINLFIYLFIGNCTGIVLERKNLYKEKGWKILEKEFA